MAYTKQTWTTGDTVTASKLNHMEDGIAEGGGSGGAMIVTVSDVNGNLTLNKTAKEIYDALLDGTPAYIVYQYGVLGEDYTGHLILAPIVKIYNYNNTDLIRVIALKSYMQSVGASPDVAGPATVIFTADGLNEYPTFHVSVYVNNNSEGVNYFIG